MFEQLLHPLTKIWWKVFKPARRNSTTADFVSLGTRRSMNINHFKQCFPLVLTYLYLRK